MFTNSIERAREIRMFPVAVVKRRLTNVQKCVMHVQSCCFANINLSLFCRSPWQPDVTLLLSITSLVSLLLAAQKRVIGRWMEWDEKLRTAVIHSKWKDPFITKFKMDISYYISSSRERTLRKTQKSSIAFIQLANIKAILLEWPLKIFPEGCQALRFPVFCWGERETRVTVDEEKGTMGRRKTWSLAGQFSPSRLTLTHLCGNP